MGLRQFRLGKDHREAGIKYMAHRKGVPYVSRYDQESYDNGYNSKSIAYKLVAVIGERLLSLYHNQLEGLSIEYSTKKPTSVNSTCFVVKDLETARTLSTFLLPHNEIYKCEGYFLPTEATRKRLRITSDCLGLAIDWRSLFMTEVRLLEKVS